MAIENPKEDINKEGWEENAAIIIGSEEERAQVRERLEKGEIVADLGTYIRLHKQVPLSLEDPEVNEDLKEKLQTMKGECWGSSWYIDISQIVDNINGEGYKGEMFYVDQKGSIANVKIDSLQIKAYEDLKLSSHDNTMREKSSPMISKLNERVTKDLKSLGFTLPPDRHGRSENLNAIKILASAVSKAIDKKQERLEAEAQEKKKKEFNF